MRAAFSFLTRFVGWVALFNSSMYYFNMKNPNDDYELREEYDLSQLPIIPKGRYAPEQRVGSNVVVLEPDLARAFPTDEAVNKALRLILQATQIPDNAG